MDDVITFDKVQKTYLTTKGKAGLLTEFIGDNIIGFFGKSKKGGFSSKKPGNSIRALRGISFKIKRGETVGIIGRNGAGKSTILKLISKISYPDGGKIRVSGRIGAFIELGAGLHPELSGRENIFLYGSILGMKRREILEKFDDIVNFAEINKFLDLPIKKYSSGMYSRLGFSVCAFCDPEILLVDEVLAVGDVNFQKKCLQKMRSFAHQKTIVFVSHNLDAIKSICDKVIYLDNGQVIKNGSPTSVVNFYLKQARKDYSSS